MKKVVFLLPGRARTPVGGYKVVFEYANRLVVDGFSVRIIYPAILITSPASFYKLLRGFARFLKIGMTKKYSCREWFNLDQSVKELWIPFFCKIYFKKNDCIIATACETAYFLQNKKMQKYKRYYLIQHYEDWVKQNILDLTWKSDLKKIVIADWLLEIAHARYNTDATLIENGLDFTQFSITIPIRKRNKYSVTMLWHKAENKGSAIGLSAILNSKDRFPELIATFFGVQERPATLPGWINYYCLPDQKTLLELYNRSAIFVAPSLSEGFGLTAAEAMQCGCAIVSSEAGGFLQFCKHNVTALVSKTGKADVIAKNIITVIQDDALRYRLAETGSTFIKRFTWERAYQKFKNALGLQLKNTTTTASPTTDLHKEA